MSGGTFDYKEYEIHQIANNIDQVIRDNGRELSLEEYININEWRNNRKKVIEDYENYPTNRYKYNFSDEIIGEFKKGLKYLRLAYVYACRIDYLLAADDAEDSFLERLKEELKKID